MAHARLLATTIFGFTILTGTALATPKLGIAMHGEPALPDDFKNLPYTNPDAPQGGTLKQAVVGTFDSTNPFIVKGNVAKDIRTYVFESLMGRNYAEAFSLYGLLAESIDVSDDRQTFTFKIRQEAKFSDGSPVLASDVQWTMETLRDHGRPNFKNNFSKISKIQIIDERTIQFDQTKGDRELPMIVGLMPILPKAKWEGKDFEASLIEPLVGSGPFVIGDIKPGESLTFKKNPDYWGKNVAFNKGLWNFDAVRYDYYKEPNAAFEAFKKGDADIWIESNPARWTTGYKIPAVESGQIKLETYVAKTPAPATGLAFNTRRAIFADARVREALIYAFDFEWANANLFSNLNKRVYGYYSGSSLSSRGKAADKAELAVLGDDKGVLRADMLDGSYQLPVTDGSGRDRKTLKMAIDLLGEAGWKSGDAGLVNAKGEPFAFTITIQNADQEKVALHFQRSLQLIGVKAEVKKIDDAQMKEIQKSFDYDMVPWTIYNSLSPGNEQVSYVGSAVANSPGTRNAPGINSPAVDKAIETMLHAKGQEEFQAAVRAEDRLLTAGFYMVPFYVPDQWVARWTHIGANPPDKQPNPGFEATTLWHEK